MTEQAAVLASEALRDRARDVPSRLTAWLAPALAAAALAGAAGGAYATAVSRHAPDPAGHAALTVVVCLTYVGAGVVALRRPPYLRFGLLLAAVGFSSLFGSLHDANDAVPYTAGVLASNLVFAVLLHALLAFPGGRLRTRWNRALVLAAYVDVVAVQALAVVFDPLTRWHSPHPRNLALLHANAPLATAIEEVEAAVAVALALAVLATLYRHTRPKSAVARRQLLPVLVGGKAGLLLLAAGLVLAPLSSRAAVVGIGLGLLASLALPGAFLGVLLQGRLSRAAVGELLVELREGGPAPGLEDALRRALGDPSLELARLDGGGAYARSDGAPFAPPLPRDPRTTTPVLHQGEPVGLLVHDRSLRLRPELLDAVSAAAGFALANERALERVQRVEERNRALLDAIPDLMFRIARDGTYLDVRADDPASLLQPPEQLIGSNVREALPRDVAAAVLACIERALETGATSTVEYELAIRGVRRWFESRMVPSGDDEVVTIVRDVTDQRTAQAELQRLAEEQAALRRVATLVAGDAPPERVFQAVTEEACTLLGIRSGLLLRYEDGARATVVGKFGEPAGEFTLGSVLELEEGAALRVLRTGAPARVRYDDLPGSIAKRMLALGFCSSVGVPISVAGETWGVLITALRAGESLPAETESRLQAFAELVGLALTPATSSPRRGCASSRRATRSGAGWSATCTTAPSSASSRSPSASASPRPRCAPRRRKPRSCSRWRRRSYPRRSPSCASWRRASTRPCSPSAACARRSRCSPPARRSPSSSTSSCPSGCPSRSRRPPTTSSPRR